MPPKRASTRRAGSTPRSGERGKQQFRDFSSPDANSLALPEIPTKHSFAYGSSAVPLLPREVAAKPKMDLTEMAHNIDVGIQAAQDRERESSKELDDVNDEPAITRSKVKHSVNASPARRRAKREPTPDQMQLLDGLREASPQHSHPGQSTPTPPPPVPQNLSTGSSSPQYPPVQRLQPNERVYPSPPAGNTSRPNQPPLSSPQTNSVDNESTISWNVERDIYDDDLQQSHPARYRRTPRGKNISAPPRRPSGLAFPQDGEEESIAESVPTPKQPPTSRTQGKSTPDVTTAPTRTIIPASVRREAPRPRMSPLRQSFTTESLGNTYSALLSRKSQVISIVVAVILMIMSVLVVRSHDGQLSDFTPSLGSWLPFGRPYPHIPLNTTGMDAVNALSNQVGKLGVQVSSLSKDVKSIKTEVDKVSSAPRVELEPVVRKEVPKVNFLSIGLGAIIDPHVTSPTIGPKRSRTRKAYEWAKRKFMTQSETREPQPPLAALAAWEDVGDCWCSALRSGMSQLSVLLGREIVPEEVVVEHIPQGAVIDWSVAPREMELWARFKISSAVAPPSTSTWFEWLLGSGGAEESFTFPGGSTLSQYIMEAVGLAYENEPESAYSDDKQLGPHFYRVGKWVYDPHEPNHIQRFTLDAVIDSPSIRVDQVVFRVKSNWGGCDTCLYRLRLHGHV